MYLGTTGVGYSEWARISPLATLPGAKSSLIIGRARQAAGLAIAASGPGVSASQAVADRRSRRTSVTSKIRCIHWSVAEKSFSTPEDETEHFRNSLHPSRAPRPRSNYTVSLGPMRITTTP